MLISAHRRLCRWRCARRDSWKFVLRTGVVFQENFLVKVCAIPHPHGGPKRSPCRSRPSVSPRRPRRGTDGPHRGGDHRGPMPSGTTGSTTRATSTPAITSRARTTTVVLAPPKKIGSDDGDDDWDDGLTAEPGSSAPAPGPKDPEIRLHAPLAPLSCYQGSDGRNQRCRNGQSDRSTPVRSAGQI